MPLTPLRKQLNIGFGLLLATAGVFALWPLLASPLELRTFCRELRPGSGEAEIRQLAAAKGFRVSPTADRRAQVYDFGSLGKFSCTLEVANGILVGTDFVVGD